jgi:dsRNA-specific ribonuclease
LQEISQSASGELPVYRLVKITGEAHDPIFEMEVTACGISMIGYGGTKKSAAHDAADRVIKKIKVIK